MTPNPITQYVHFLNQGKTTCGVQVPGPVDGGLTDFVCKSTGLRLTVRDDQVTCPACEYALGMDVPSGKPEPGPDFLVTFQSRVAWWAGVRDIFHKSSPEKQCLKSCSEMGELADAVAEGNKAKIQDGIGDVIVTLAILARMTGTCLEDCMEAAWDEIKDRDGEMVNGVFVKAGVADVS